MSKDIKPRIRIYRSEHIESSRDIAVLRLDMAIHKVGQPCMVSYRNPDGEIDTLFGLGVKDGTGPDCWQVMAQTGLNLVRDVSTELPDVSALVHGETYIWIRPADKIAHYVTLNPDGSGHRKIEPITGEPKIFANIEDTFRWFYRDGRVRREDEFSEPFDATAILDKLTNLEEEIEILKLCGGGGSGPIDTFPVAITIKSPSAPYLVGEVYDLTLGIVAKRLPSQDPIPKDELIVTVAGVEQAMSDPCDFSLTGIQSGTTLSIDVKDKKTGKTKTIKVSMPASGKFWWGPIPEESWEINEENIKALQFKITKPKGSIETFVSMSLKRFAFVGPKLFGDIKHIYDWNNFDYIHDYVKSLDPVTIEGSEYYVWTKVSAVSVDDYKQTFTY